MEEDKEANAQYNRWNEDNINLNVAASQPTMMRVYDRLCTGNIGIAMKVGGAVAVMVILFVIGYATGYYVHRC